MRLIIKDYLLQLTEKDELDFLIGDLLLQMGYATDNQPKTGNRQYGVDIRAQNEEEILLCVIKQGDIVSIDLGAAFEGYHGDNAATFAAGDISKEAQRLMDVTKQSLEKGIAAAIAG